MQDFLACVYHQRSLILSL
uniref:Uncharacterized protein n=1 Tax=Anguilla anguilla TaxID=7936 RepID=A0A0E9SKY9_ANGAN